ncbi:uncharacterized protein AB9X84_001886 isoform 3-T6 [Acanthopagrus schlegelii]
MRVTCLGFFLLLWFPGVLHAQSAARHCDAPRLPHGYFVSEQNEYDHGRTLTYACEKGHKPSVEGWWAASTCQSGTWSPKPQCIVEEGCIPPTIPNAKYTESLTGWYEDGDKIRITCDEAYELKNNDATALCTNGSWSSVPVCERSADACDAPPKVSHAVIVDHRHQELFAADTHLQYECEDGYTAEGAGNDKTIVCIAGTWTEGPTCSRGTTPSTGHGGGSSDSSLQPAGGGSAATPGAGRGGSTEGATGGSGTQPAGRGTTPSTGHGGGSSDSSLQPAGGGSAATPGAGRGGSTEGATGGSGTQPAGRGTTPSTGHGGGSSDSSLQPAGGGSSTTSDSNGSDSRPSSLPTKFCSSW